MVTTIKGIDLGSTGMRESSILSRERIEQNQSNLVTKLTKEAFERIKKLTQTDSDEPVFVSFPISKFLGEYGISAEDKATKTQVAYNLKKLENIITRWGEAENRIVPDNMKPFAYSCVSKDTKAKLGLKAYCMKNLSEEMKEYIYEMTRKKNVQSDIYDLLLVCDYLTAHNAHKQWLKLMGLKLSADLGQPIRVTKQALEDLIAAHVLLTGKVKRSTRGKDTICRLTYHIKEFGALNNQLLSGQAEDEYRASTETDIVVNENLIERHVTTLEDKIIPLSKTKNITASIQQSINDGLGLTTQKSLTKNQNESTIEDTLLGDTFDEALSGEDIKCLKHIISRLKNTQSNDAKSKEGSNEKTVQQLRDLLSSAQVTENQLRKDLANAERELNTLKHDLKIQEEFNQAYAAEARKSMSHLISSVTTTVENFSKKPVKQITGDDIAEFKNDVITAAVNAQNRLKEFTYSKKVESLKK